MGAWRIFCTPTSEQQRLRAALSGYFDMPDLPEEQHLAYASYLQKRIRPAVENLIREDDFSKLESILQTNWLSDADRKRFLNSSAICSIIAVFPMPGGPIRRIGRCCRSGTSGIPASSLAKYALRAFSIVSFASCMFI